MNNYNYSDDEATSQPRLLMCAYISVHCFPN